MKKWKVIATQQKMICYMRCVNAFFIDITNMFVNMTDFSCHFNQKDTLRISNECLCYFNILFFAVMEFEGSNNIERRSAVESVEISECIDNKTAEESVETSEHIEKRNVDTSHAQVAMGEEELVEPMSFKLCGDNLDKTVKR